MLSVCSVRENENVWCRLRVLHGLMICDLRGRDGRDASFQVMLRKSLAW